VRGALSHAMGDMLGSFAALIAGGAISAYRLDAGRPDPLQPGSRC
jgi:Co/Zn/Cd efflux system component